ncbi:MAG: hypothetical protein EHM34_06180 [Nitrosopumilales archaeon]|nr:MAG: hypothetical protein EHM34_06180 [Nitrosopumilales archaeon]
MKNQISTYLKLSDCIEKSCTYEEISEAEKQVFLNKNAYDGVIFNRLLKKVEKQILILSGNA